MNSRMYSVAEADIVTEFVQFAVYGELARVRAVVRQEGKAVVGGNNGIRQDVIAIEEEFQHREACAADGAVPSRVRWMGWRAFGKRLRKQPRSILIETLLQSLRFKDDMAQFACGLIALSGLN